LIFDFRKKFGRFWIFDFGLEARDCQERAGADSSGGILDWRNGRFRIFAFWILIFDWRKRAECRVSGVEWGGIRE